MTNQTKVGETIRVQLKRHIGPINYYIYTFYSVCFQAYLLSYFNETHRKANLKTQNNINFHIMHRPQAQSFQLIFKVYKKETIIKSIKIQAQHVTDSECTRRTARKLCSSKNNNLGSNWFQELKIVSVASSRPIYRLVLQQAYNSLKTDSFKQLGYSLRTKIIL